MKKNAETITTYKGTTYIHKVNGVPDLRAQMSVIRYLIEKIDAQKKEDAGQASSYQQVNYSTI